MARSFNISAVFTAVNKLSAPVKQMTQSISQFAQATKTASSSANTAFHSTATAAQSAVSKIRSAFNNINFNRLKFQIKNIGGHIKDLGQTAAGIGAAGAGAGYAVYKGLDPLREKQSVVTRFGTLYGQGKSSEEKAKLGEAEFAKTQDMATRLPGAVQDFAEARAMTKNFGLEGSFDLLKGFTNISSAIGEKFDGEFIRALQAGAGGNDVDLFKKFGLKAGSDKGKTKLTDVATGKETVFKNPADVLKFISQLGNKKYAGSTDEYMKTISGKESNVGDALSGVSINFAEQSGLVQLYAEKLDLITTALPKIGVEVTKLLKPLIDFAKQHETLTNAILIAIPVLGILGGSIFILTAVISGLGTVLAAVTALFSPLGLLIAAVGAALLYIVTNWEDVKQGFKIGMDYIYNLFSGFVMGITNWVTEWVNLGGQLVINFQTGISNKWETFKSWLLTKFSDLLSSIPVIGASLSARLNNTSQVDNLNSTKSSPLLNKQSILNNPAPVVHITNNIDTSVTNGTASTNASSSSSGAKPIINTNTGQSRRTSK